MKTITLLLAFSFLSGCQPSLQQMQETLSAYHVQISAPNAASVVVSSEAVAMQGEIGTELVMTAPIGPDGSRGVVLRRTIDASGFLGWRIVLSAENGDARWLELQRITCTQARELLEELPPCVEGLVPAEFTGETVRVRIYPKQE